MRVVAFRLGFLLLLMTPSARAHPSDISYLRVKLERQRVEMRFTFNLVMLTRFVGSMDANGDRQIDMSELDASTPKVLAFLGQKVQIEVNGQKATLGKAKPLEYVWPSADGTMRVAEADYPVRYVDITFTQDVSPVLADVWLGFDLWEQTGPLGTIEATYEQDELRTQVPFSLSEPDYLYDTGYAVESVFQEPAKSHDWRPWALGTALCIVALVAWWRLVKSKSHA
jgi:hypothetical protein